MLIKQLNQIIILYSTQFWSPENKFFLKFCTKAQIIKGVLWDYEKLLGCEQLVKIKIIVQINMGPESLRYQVVASKKFH